MKVARRIATNSIFILLTRVSELISGIIIVILATRYLGLKAFGEYTFIRVVSFVFMPIISWGTLRILIRDMSVEAEKVPVLLTSGLVVNGLMTIVVVLCGTGVIVAFRLTSTVAIVALYLAILSQVLIAMRKTVECVFLANESMFFVSLTTFISRGLSVLFFLLAINYDFGMIGLFVALAAANTTGLLSASIVSAFKFARPKWPIDVRQLSYLFRESFSIAISTFLRQGYTYVCVFFLKIFQDIEHVSLFQAPQRIVAPLLLLPSSALMAFVPTLSRLASDENSISVLQSIYHKIFKYIIIFTLPIAVCGTLYAPRIILLLFGRDFLKATIAFRILIWTIPLLSLNVLLSFILTSIKQQKVLITSGIACFVSNGVLGVILVQKYGYIGASVTSLLSYSILFTFNFCFLSKHVKFLPVHRIILRPFFACITVYLLLFALESKLNVVPLIIIALLLYFGLLFLSKTFTSDEINIFRSTISSSSHRNHKQ
ncbi:polysaccharide biosynthesis C-terminal domain-containing protein [Planctomycetota bacterium]